MERIPGWFVLVLMASFLCGSADAQAPVESTDQAQLASSAQSQVASLAPDQTTAGPQALFSTVVRPPASRPALPQTRWQHKSGHAVWTRAALSALKAHGKPLVDLVPADIGNWCPAYPQATDRDRRAFWVGFLSALAKHESTYRATAVGGNGRWYGLLQILPGTARGYKCNVGTGRALKNGAANLSCAIRIMAVTVPRDGVIYGRGGRGVAADWGPMRSSSKRRDMAGWLREQSYCQNLSSKRPKLRP
ncbi:transglycosylase SLT domain-containing protein [Sulfitobacter sp. JB4-11]|uniref:transglycosylase SLT domain-containing protein n=1 Tax=Sulfitobacter rhodophyticola TaxID=3238304 RepID=UPI003516015A